MSNSTPHDNLNTTPSSIIQQLLSLPYLIHGYIIPPERIAILKLGRPTPVLKSLNKPRAISILKKTIKFESKIYIKNSWMTGCSESERLYCWPCLLLAHSSTCTWNTEGHIPHTPNDALKHAQQDSHIIAEKILSQILEVLKSNPNNLQFKIVNNSMEILNYLEIQEIVQFEAQIENLNLANNAESCYDSVLKLLVVDSALSTKAINKQKLELAKIGRPTPFLPNSIYTWMKVDGCYVKVLKEYIETPWLAGCVKTQKLYCWPCTLFSLPCDINTVGHKYWTESMKTEHLKSNKHLVAIGLYNELDQILYSSDPLNINIKKLHVLHKKLKILCSGLDTNKETGPKVSKQSLVPYKINPKKLDKVSKIRKVSIQRNSKLPSLLLKVQQNRKEPHSETIEQKNECTIEASSLPPDNSPSIIEQLLSIPYLIYGDIIPPERLEIMKLDRPTPTLTYPLSSSSSSTVSYNTLIDEQGYLLLPWLTGCVNKQRLYCWPCLLLCPQDTSKWNEEGSQTLIVRETSYHSNQASHQQAVKMYAQLLDILKNYKDIQLIFDVYENKIEIISELELKEYDEVKKEMEISYLKVQSSDSTQIKNSIKNLLNMQPVLLTGTISEERIKIARLGRPTPPLPNTRNVLWIKFEDHYVSMPRVYYETQWLCGCENTGNLYCWYCLFFGFNNVNKLYWLPKMKSAHISGSVHQKAVMLYELLKDKLKDTHVSYSSIDILKKYGDRMVTVTDITMIDKEVMLVEKGQDEGDEPMLSISDHMVNTEHHDNGDDVIPKLLKISYLHLFSTEKLKIIYSGIPKPRMTESFAGCVDLNQYYTKIPWLTASAVLNKLYCWPCLLFKKFPQRFCLKYNLQNMNKLDVMLKLHKCTVSHVKAVKIYDQVVEILSEKQHCNLKLAMTEDFKVHLISEEFPSAFHEEIDIKTESDFDMDN